MPDLILSPPPVTSSPKAAIPEKSTGGAAPDTQADAPSFAATLKSAAEGAEKKPAEPDKDEKTTLNEPTSSDNPTLTVPFSVVQNIINTLNKTANTENRMAANTLNGLLQADRPVEHALATVTANIASQWQAKHGDSPDPDLALDASAKNLTQTAVLPAPTFASAKTRFAPATDAATPTKIADLAATSADITSDYLKNPALNQATDTSNLVATGASSRMPEILSPANQPAASVLSLDHELAIDKPMSQIGWREEISQKVTWLVNNRHQQAELTLNPPQLGRIEVTLVMDGNQVNASFQSPHPGVRESLDNAMDRLRETLANAGVTLGQTHVGAESRQDQQAMNSKPPGSVFGRQQGHFDIVAPGEGSFQPPKTARQGMVNIFV
ncbi:MAG: flagellar hook-length control protein FliK [Rugosibacter sp.]|jgi:flagellar hook-length control protein FliK